MDELFYLDKFTIAINKNCELKIPDKITAVPDFVITSENKKIGIEHTRIMNSDSQILIKTTIRILKLSENILLQKNPALKEIVNISINYWKVNINGKNLADRLSKQDKMM